MGFLETDQLA